MRYSCGNELVICHQVTEPSRHKKQPPRGVRRKWCYEHMQQIYSRTPMPKCDFNHGDMFQ